MNANSVPVPTSNNLRDLPIQLAITEILEYLFLQSAYGEDTDINLNLQVKIRQVGTLSEDSGDYTCFQIKVLVQDNVTTYFGLHTFFEVKQHSSCLQSVIKKMEAVHKGVHVWTTDSAVYEEWSFRDGTARSRPDTTTKYSPITKIVFRIMQRKSHMLSECDELRMYMHRLKIVHSLVELHLNVCDKETTFTFYGPYPQTKNRRKPASALAHYKRIDGRCNFGLTITIRSSPFVKLSVGRKSSGLHIRVGACLFPPFESSNVFYNRDCTHLQMIVYGPGRMPMVIPGINATAVQGDALFNLSEFGMRLGAEVGRPPPPDEKSIKWQLGFEDPVIADYRYELHSLDPKDVELRQYYVKTSDKHRKISHTIHLFVYIEEDSPLDDVLQVIDLLHRLRQNLQQTLTKYQDLVKKALHGALSKVLDNPEKVLAHKPSKRKRTGEKYGDCLEDSGKVWKSFNGLEPINPIYQELLDRELAYMTLPPNERPEQTPTEWFDAEQFKRDQDPNDRLKWGYNY